MFVPERVPVKESFDNIEAINEYNNTSRSVITPIYKYFLWKILRKGIRKGRVLDLGAGPGFFLIELAKAKNTDFQIVGIDVSPGMMLKAKENIKGYGRKIDLQLASASELPFKDNSFDIVVSNNSLHHWAEPAAVFNEIQRVVKPEGFYMIRDNKRVALTVWWKAFVWLSAGIMRMSRKQVDSWMRANLACYTPAEIRKILESSELKDWVLRSDFMRFQCSIEKI